MESLILVLGPRDELMKRILFQLVHSLGVPKTLIIFGQTSESEVYVSIEEGIELRNITANDDSLATAMVGVGRVLLVDDPLLTSESRAVNHRRLLSALYKAQVTHVTLVSMRSGEANTELEIGCETNDKLSAFSSWSKLLVPPSFSDITLQVPYAIAAGVWYAMDFDAPLIAMDADDIALAAGYTLCRIDLQSGEHILMGTTGFTVSRLISCVEHIIGRAILLSEVDAMGLKRGLEDSGVSAGVTKKMLACQQPPMEDMHSDSVDAFLHITGKQPMPLEVWLRHNAHVVVGLDKPLMLSQ